VLPTLFLTTPFPGVVSRPFPGSILVLLALGPLGDHNGLPITKTSQGLGTVASGGAVCIEGDAELFYRGIGGGYCIILVFKGT
jgi:hypothetical protein